MDLEIDLYLAGLFDGEGHARVQTCVCRKDGYEFERYQPMISIKMTDKEPVQVFFERFGGALTYKVPSPDSNSKKPYWVCVLESVQALKAAVVLAPISRNPSKVKQLLGIVGFYDERLRGVGRAWRGFPKKRRKEVADLVESIRVLGMLEDGKVLHIR